MYKRQPPHLRAGASGASGSAPPPREAPTERWAPREPRGEPREAPTERWAPRQAREPASQPPAASNSEESKPASGGKWVPKWKQQS